MGERIEAAGNGGSGTGVSFHVLIAGAKKLKRAEGGYVHSTGRWGQGTGVIRENLTKAPKTGQKQPD